MNYPNVAKLFDALIDTYLNKNFHPSFSYDITYNKKGERKEKNNKIITYCNKALHSIMSRFGYKDFKGKLANQLIDIIKKDKKRWCRYAIMSEESIARGWIVVACRKINPHGHVAVLRPGEFVKSEKWNLFVPKCLNIGKNNFIDKGVNWAFDKKPEYYIFFRIVDVTG